MQVVTGALHRVQRGRGKRFSADPPQPSRRPARVAVMLALAHTILQAIDRGEIRDQADAARRLGVTRARITQVVDLSFLPPDLQETILFLEARDGREPVGERGLRQAATSSLWKEKRRVVTLSSSEVRPKKPIVS